jgi:hypothetical protein
MKDIETGKPIGAQYGARLRLPPRRPLLLGLIILLTGLLWMAELHWLLWYTMNCEYLSHRDPRFVTPENNYLCLSDAELAGVLRDLAITAVAIFEAHNITYFLESGTLLGAFREHAVIRHDTDVDLGIDAHGLTYLRHHPVEVPDAYKLAVWNSALYPDSTCDDKLPARLTHKATGLYADVFAFMEWKNSEFWEGQDAVGPVASVCYSACQACPRVGERYRHFTVPRHWVYPLVDCLFEGRTFKCPRQPAKYLEHMYGKDFMIPA